MLMDIFSTFDPNTSYWTILSPTMFWMSSMLILSLIHASFWMKPNWTLWLTIPMLHLMSNQTHRTTGIQLKGFNSMLSPLFIMLISLNLMGLIPYVFSITSQLLFTLSLALPLWLMLIISALQKAPKSTIAHLLPSSTPDWLSMPLILIETTSIFVRPITLSFRLAANMSAGHIVITLIGTYISSIIFSSILWFIILTIIQMTYTLFEMGICLIQAYIFCLLLSLYSDEHATT